MGAERFARLPGVLTLWHKFRFGSVATRTQYGIWPRPNYAYGIYHAALQAKKLGIPAISAIELGVAGGNGLSAMENIAAEIANDTGVKVVTYGFDTGKGMPPPVDYRDVPHVWQQGFFEMDEAKLRKRLHSAQLVLGNVAETIPEFVNRKDVPTIGFIAFDLDYYSSTMTAFGLFEGASSTRLPRVYAYFDDLMWPEHACHNPFIGELAAIAEFNNTHPDKKLAPIHMLQYMRPMRAAWHEQMYVLHDFAHPHYCTNLTDSAARHTQLPL